VAAKFCGFSLSFYSSLARRVVRTMDRLQRLALQVVPPCSTRSLPVSPAAVSATGPSARRFDSQVAIVTGGASGIGLQAAKVFGLGGAHVCLIDLGLDRLAEATKELQQAGVQNVKSYECDVTREESVRDSFASAIKDHGDRVDILVQAAGITGKTGIKSHEVETANFQQVFRVNLEGTFLCCKAVLPAMLKRNYGRIVNIASVAGKDGNAGMLAYSASKAGVIGLTKVMGKEYAETGITVNAISPAVIRTKMVAAMPEAQVNYMLEKIPMKRTGTLEEIGNLIAFVASQEASFTTAFCWDATGGRSTY